MDKKIPLKMEVYEKLEQKAKTEGKTPDQKASEIVVEKSTEKPVKKKGKAQKETTDKSVFPAKGMINAYGFIHLSNGVARAFGAPKGKKMRIGIDYKDGSLIITKA